MRARGFLGRLFGRRSHGEEPVLTLDRLIELACAQGHEHATGSSAEVVATRLEEKEIPDTVAGVGEGVATRIVGESDQAGLAILYPQTWLSAPGRLPAGAPGGDPTRTLIAEMESALTRVAALLPPEENAGPALSLTPVLRTRHHLTAADRPLLAWWAHDTTAWRIRAPEPGPLVLMPSAAAERLQTALAGSEDTRSEVARLVLGHEGESAPPVSPATRLELRSPRELLAARFFLPSRVACGAHVVQTKFHHAGLGTAAAKPPGGPGIWITAGATVANQPWRFSCFFHVETAKAQALAGTLRQLLACELREALKAIASLGGTSPQKPVVAPGGGPDPAKLGSYLCLEGTVSVSGLTIPCDVWVPAPCLAAICAAAMESWDWAQARLEKPAILAALLGLSQTLLRNDVGRLHREVLETRGGKPEDPWFPFAAFLEIAPDRDARLALQNHVVPSLGSRSLRSLFSYAEIAKTSDGKPLRRIVTPVAVDEARLQRFLPRQALAEWREGRPELPDRAGWLELNAEILGGMRAAARKRQLLLSQRARAILDTLYYPIASAATRGKLDAAKAARLPFSELEKLPGPRIQEILNRLPGRTVCLALVGADAEMGLVRANTSRTKSEELGRDLVNLKRQIEQGAIDLEDVLDAKQAVADEAIRVREADEKQERGRPGAPAAAGRPAPASRTASTARPAPRRG